MRIPKENPHPARAGWGKVCRPSRECRIAAFPHGALYFAVTVVFIVHDRSGLRSGSGLNELILAVSLRTVPGLAVTFTVTSINSSPNRSRLPTVQVAVPAENEHGVVEQPLVSEHSDDAT